MNRLISELERYENDLNKAKARKEAVAARLELAMTDLTRSGFSSIKEATERVDTINKALIKKEEEIQELFAALKEKHSELFTE